MSKKIKIFLGIPSNGKWVDSLAHLIPYLQQKYADKIELVYPENLVNRIFHDYARNEIVKDFLQSDCDILWFIDSDVTPPGNILDMVTNHVENWDIAGAPYPVFMTPPGYDIPMLVFTVYKQLSSGGLYAASVPSSGCEFVEGLATDCMFIKREVFEKLKAPYFEFKFDDQRKIVEGEDLGFCRKVNELGYKFFVDYSMVCRHRKEIDLIDVSNYAMKYAKHAVTAYDRDIRSKVEQLSQAVLQGQIKPTSSSKSKLILP